ncbi:hypothetical protein H0G86_006098 [Trichoderma simmonsii]|uniref:Uncharacterized protein n=1 Tax=Trichoderma simmonsii TaxID=1491479 RepID=A0A8G0PFS4_9HYPO|nr:hypothetical protein H0G86_006098 [Trichoderma simmonsii]
MSIFHFLGVANSLIFSQRHRRERNTSIPPNQSPQPSHASLGRETAASTEGASTFRKDPSKEKILKEIASQHDAPRDKASRDDNFGDDEAGDDDESGDGGISRDDEVGDDNLREDDSRDDDTLENDGDSTQTMPPSYQEATAASENVADPDGSRLDNSCLSHLRLYILLYPTIYRWIIYVASVAELETKLRRPVFNHYPTKTNVPL